MILCGMSCASLIVDKTSKSWSSLSTSALVFSYAASFYIMLCVWLCLQACTAVCVFVYACVYVIVNLSSLFSKEVAPPPYGVVALPPQYLGHLAEPQPWNCYCLRHCISFVCVWLSVCVCVFHGVLWNIAPEVLKNAFGNLDAKVYSCNPEIWWSTKVENPSNTALPFWTRRKILCNGIEDVVPIAPFKHQH